MTTDPVRIIVAGIPQPWARPRFHTNKLTGEMHGFTPAKVQQNRDYIQKCAADAMAGREPFAGCALEVRALCVVPFPSSIKASDRNLIMAGIHLPVAKRPDIDQYVKQFFDAFTGVVWNDDSQVAALHVEKVYGIKPRMEIQIQPYRVEIVAQERSLFDG